MQNQIRPNSADWRASPVSEKLILPALRTDSWQRSKGVKQLWLPVLRLLIKTARGQLGSVVVKS